MCRIVAILFIALTIAFVFVGCTNTNSKLEILSGICDNGVKWQYDDGVFTLKGIEIFRTHKSVVYELSVYNINGDLMEQAVVTDNKFKTLIIPIDVTYLNEYCLKIAFFNNAGEPISNTFAFDIVNVEPNCVSNGYQSVYTYSTDTKKIFNVVPALKHEFGEGIIVIEPSNIVESGQKEFVCTKCRETQVETYYSNTDIARLCVYGDLAGIGKRSEVCVMTSFFDEDKNFNCYALLKYQGHTSLVYDKKNFTIKFFSDEEMTHKYKIEFGHWYPEHKYILKANYIDPSICRNLVCAEIWSEMVAQRHDNKLLINSSSTLGVTDGFPVALYMNDEFFGLYTMTLHRDDDLFGMDDGNMDAIAVTNTNHTDESYFKKIASFSDSSDWEVEYNGLPDDTWVKAKVNELIGFVNESSDEAFKDNLKEYLDVNSAIDYLIAVYALGLPDNSSRNITLVTYSDDQWIMSLCDMECAFGLMPSGTGFYPVDWCLPINSKGEWNSNTGSLLWDRLLNNFEIEIRTRYAYLRGSVLTPETIVEKVITFVSAVPQEFYEADAELYPQMPFQDISATEQIEEYVTERLALLDDILMY